MNFATWSIRNPIPSIVLFTLLGITGLWSFNQLPIQDFPDLDLPVVNVALRLPGAAPSQLESEVARIVEDSLATLSGLQHMQTTVTDGLVQIGIEFELEKKLSDALIETKDAVDRVRSELPVEVEQPSVTAINLAGGEPLQSFAVSADGMDEEALSWFLDDTIGRTILGVPGVGNFVRVGGVEREIRVEVDPVRMAALHVTATDISRALKRVQQEASGGRGQLGATEQSLRTVATVVDAASLQAFPVALPDGSHLRLDQVAEVIDTVAERSQAALLNGKAVVGFQVFRAKGYDEVSVSAGVQAAAERLVSEHEGLKITQVATTVDFTREQFKGSMHMLYEGALLAILVVWWFLRDWRATLVAATALPLSIIPTFAMMSWVGYSLNTITLLSLAAVIGILVDDAIVEVENIDRHLRGGKSVTQAAGDAVTEIGLAVIATTATLVAVFMPTAFMSGIPGIIFKQFGWTAVVSVTVSLLVARILTPMMAAHFLKPHPGGKQDAPMMSRYLRLVHWCLTHRGMTITLAAAFFAGSLMLLPMLPTGLIPPQDRGFTRVTVELPPGSTIDATLATVESARAVITDIPGIKDVFTTVGEGLQTTGSSLRAAGDVRRGVLTINMLDRNERPPQIEIENLMREHLLQVPGARFAIGGGGAPGEKLSVILTSDNPEALKATGRALERELRGISYLSNVSSTASLERPEISFRPLLQQMAERGVTTATIGETLRVATSGDFDAQLAKLNLEARQVPIRVRLPDTYRTDLNTFANLRVPGSTGPVPLSSVAELSIASGPSQIDRFDRQRFVSVTADLGGAALGMALDAVYVLPSMVGRPSNVNLLETGDAELMMELFSGFSIAIVTGVLCVLAVLILLFKDFLQPITILSALPLSIGGSLIALLLTGLALSLPSLIGIVMLMGIVTKNSILLVEYAIVGMRDRGLDMTAALLDSCHKRARPIIMTSVAMIAGMLPLALGFGADSSFRQPMAITVIGGLVTSTALSLLVVPVAFTYMMRFEQWLRRLGSRDRVVPLQSAQ